MKIAISGTPGTGKTMVARALAKLTGFRLIELNELAKQKNLYLGYDKKRKSKIVDIGAIAKETKSIQGNVIMESHYAHDMPCDVIVVLRTSSTELCKRLEKRKWCTIKIEENVEAEKMCICLGEAKDSGRPVIEIDTTKKETKEVAREIELSLKRLNLI
jgi:adenylate kinase